MAKRRSPGLWVLLAGLVCASGVHGQITPIEVDGCARLARVIHSEVAAAVIYGPGKSGPWLIELGQGDISICTHTTRTVSRAFTSAMQSAGVSVSWHADKFETKSLPIDYCLNAFLSQCSPDRSPPDIVGGSHPDFVQTRWAVVAKAVMQEMYNPFTSDEVRFRDNDLKLRIGLSLRSIGVTRPRSLPSPR